MAKNFIVSRSREIAAAPETVFPYLDDLHRWQLWSPWEGLDADLHRTYSEPANGVGARYAWEGNRKAGKGRLEITHAEPSRVALDLHFEKPFRADHQVAFTLEPTALGTLVTWATSGRKNLMMRALSPVVNMDKMLGQDVEKGLAQLQVAVERGA